MIINYYNTYLLLLLLFVDFNIDTNSADSKIKRHELMNAEEIVLNNSSNKLLKLSDNNEWPFLDSNTLFLRDFYSSFYDEYIGNYKEKAKIVISGTPGIGKSAFGCYAIYRALKDGKIVVFQTAEKPASWLIYEADTVSEVFENKTPGNLLDSTNVLYICDSVRPWVVECPTLLITSPKKSVWFEFTKEKGSVMKFFPVWSGGDELELLRQNCFPNITAESMNRQVNVWGEIPRIALTMPEKFTEESLKSLIGASQPQLLPHYYMKLVKMIQIIV